MRHSKVLAKLRADQPVLITTLNMAPNPLGAEMAGMLGIDCLWVDTEHRPYTQNDVARVITAARLTDMDVIVRIRKGEGYSAFFRPLEDGAAGIMVPHVTTREEAEWVARNAKFPPIGRRGVETAMPDADLTLASPKEFLEHANRETFVAIQIEDAEALEHIDEIAAVPGVEILFIGLADLSVSLGVPFQNDHPLVQNAIRRVGEAAAKAGKWWGHPAKNTEVAMASARLGARFFSMGGDFTWIREGLRQMRRDFDAAMTEFTPRT